MNFGLINTSDLLHRVLHGAGPLVGPGAEGASVSAREYM